MTGSEIISVGTKGIYFNNEGARQYGGITRAYWKGKGGSCMGKVGIVDGLEGQNYGQQKKQRNEVIYIR